MADGSARVKFENHKASTSQQLKEEEEDTIGTRRYLLHLITQSLINDKLIEKLWNALYNLTIKTGCCNSPRVHLMLFCIARRSIFHFGSFFCIFIYTLASRALQTQHTRGAAIIKHLAARLIYLLFMFLCFTVPAVQPNEIGTRFLISNIFPKSNSSKNWIFITFDPLMLWQIQYGGRFQNGCPIKSFKDANSNNRKFFQLQLKS